MAYCSQCGKELSEGMTFCTYCGAQAPQMSRAEAPAEAAPAEPAPPFYTAAPPVYAPPAFSPAPPPVYGAPPTFNLAPAAPGQINFVNSFLGIVVLAGLLIIAFAAGVIGSPNFITAVNFENMLLQIVFFAMIAFAAAVSTRAKGPDLSICSIMALSAIIIAGMSGSLISGILISLFVCAAVGLLNGVITTYLHVPAIIITLLTGFIARGVGLLITGAMPIMVTNPDILVIGQGRGAGLPFGALMLFAVTFIAAFLTIMLTKLGVPTYKRERKGTLSYMFAYMVSALIASLAGLFLLARAGAANSSLGSGYEPFILLVFACVAGSRIIDNRIAPAIYAIAPALLYTIANNALLLLGVEPFYQSIFSGVLALIFIVLAYITKRFGSIQSAGFDPR